VRRCGGNSETAERLETAEQKLALLSGQLKSSEILVQRLSEERDTLRRENRELERLRSTRSPCVDSVVMDHLGAAECWLQLQSQHLESSETLIRQLSEEGDRLRSQDQELRAELTTVRATQRGDQHSRRSGAVQFVDPAASGVRPARSGGTSDSTGVTATTWIGLEGVPRMATGYPE